MNQPLFRKIVEVIHVENAIDFGVFNMGTWESSNTDTGASCGTSRCLAGWAIYFELKGAPLYDAGVYNSQRVIDLAERIGARMINDGFVDMADLGAKLLGLDERESSIFFADEETAAEFARRAARGNFAGARELL